MTLIFWPWCRGVVDALLDAGFPVSIMTAMGTALHEAALCGKVDVVRRLLEAAIDVTLKNSAGLTALRIVQDLPTPVAQEIASLVQRESLSNMVQYCNNVMLIMLNYFFSFDYRMIYC